LVYVSSLRIAFILGQREYIHSTNRIDKNKYV